MSNRSITLAYIAAGMVAEGRSIAQAAADAEIHLQEYDRDHGICVPPLEICRTCGMSQHWRDSRPYAVDEQKVPG